METVELHLHKETLERARKVAEARDCTLDELVQRLLENLVGHIPPKKSQPGPDPAIGLFADEPELMDQVLESIMKDREQRSLRKSCE